MASLTEGNRLHDVLKWEQDNLYSREKVTVLSGEKLVALAVVGKITNATPTTGTAAAANTGDGTMTAVTAGEDVQIGTYTMTCISAVLNAGVFAVTAPDGDALPEATVAVAYVNDQINFLLNDGAADFVVGDIFTVDVAEGSGKVVEVKAAAGDGSQTAYGFLAAAVDASSADTSGTAIVRDAIIVSTDLAWPTGATTAQKTAWLADLAAAGIVARTEA
ncbi:MAG: head decoration protein [Desulfobulbales bacterium]|nr:head decoration protein [Desulfobulbales bacterium]